MEFSFDSQKSDSSVASGRLKKAIERNRARQAKREAKVTGNSGLPSSRPTTLGASRSVSGANSILRSSGVQPKTAQVSRASSGNGPMGASASLQRPFGQRTATTSSLSRTAQNPASSTMRKSVARADDFEFAGEISPRANRSLSSSGTTNYAKTTARRKVKTKARMVKSKSQFSYLDYFVKACWLFGAFLFLRLIFAEGGVIDYYRAIEAYKEKGEELARQERENSGLQSEITKIKTSARYQKKIVRDHLGYIASDEYLILFPKDSSGTL